MKQKFFSNRSKADLLFESLALLGLLSSVCLYIFSIDSLPEKIPTHFGFSGKPDSWGSKNNLVIPLIVSFFMYLLLTISWFFPDRFNYPVKINSANKENLRKIGQRLLLLIKAELIFIFLFLQYQTIQISYGKAEGLGSVFILIFLGIVLGTIGVFIFKMNKAK